jgi:DNA helicase HerA-like ATPase
MLLYFWQHDFLCAVVKFIYFCKITIKQPIKLRQMINSEKKLLIAKSEIELCLNPRMANRHGLIAGATGTGKTVSLQVMAEAFSSIGVPVFMSDIKGDLSGVGKIGTSNQRISDRISQLQIEGFHHTSFPVTFWDLFGEQGHPLRTTISEMGPLLLGRLLNLNDIQNSVLTLVFRIADDNDLLLLDLKDLQKMCEYIGNNREQFTTKYGNISAASIGAIQRELIGLEEQNADKFFGEPTIDIFDFMQTDSNGMGMINILAADKLMMSPRTYSTLLLYLMSELFERLPEVGDLDKPRLVFFFDEAHLLFNDASKVVIEKIEQVVRLIRSKGVGIYFITQNPIDIPETVLGQLGNKIQHALRAFTPRDQKAVKTAAETFRANPSLDVEKVISEMGVGEALVSFLDEKGIPSMVERAKVLPPQAQIGPISSDERANLLRQSLVAGVYEKAVDRESAFEILQNRVNTQIQEVQQEKERILLEKEQTERAKIEAREEKQREKSAGEGIFGDLTKVVGRSVTQQIGSQLGRALVRGLLGGLMGGSKSKKFF